MKKAFTSVIVLNYNGEKIIANCLDHLLAQTYRNFEIIVVDNNSSDRSQVILEGYLGRSNLSVIRSKTNRGVSGGRNLGLRYAQGDLIAFIDNDGYAAPTWLEELVRKFEADKTVGAVASVVFFNKRKNILNGAGGTINYQGYGGDYCFNTPYEFAIIPEYVLYPMGCGMAVRRTVIEKIGDFDPLLFNYYDDTELGIRVWRAGFKVVVAENAWVDHDFSFSDQFLNNKVYLCERNRIRIVLKYYPFQRLFRWLIGEWYLFRYLRHYSLWSIPFRVWFWNVAHLGSAIQFRNNQRSAPGRFWHLLQPTTGGFPTPRPNNQLFRPEIRRSSARCVFDGASDLDSLNFGWYYPERDGSILYRWASPLASAIFNLKNPSNSLSIEFRMPVIGQNVAAFVRALGSASPDRELCFTSSSTAWNRVTLACNLKQGLYELLLSTENHLIDQSGRALGIAIASVSFE